jgi:hypothetical protein
MAVARCDKCGRPVGLKSSYGHRHVSEKRGRFMCGTTNCTQPAYGIWLNDAEQTAYARGERFYGVQGHGTIRVM